MGPSVRCCYAGTLALAGWVHFKVKIQRFRFRTGNRLVAPVRQRPLAEIREGSEKVSGQNATRVAFSGVWAKRQRVAVFQVRNNFAPTAIYRSGKTAVDCSFQIKPCSPSPQPTRARGDGCEIISQRPQFTTTHARAGRRSCKGCGPHPLLPGRYSGTTNDILFPAWRSPGRDFFLLIESTVDGNR